MSDVVVQSGLSRPTAHRLLSTLIRAGLVEQEDETGRYQLGANSYALGVIAEDKFGLTSLSNASVDRLAEISEDTAFFSIRKGAASICLRRQEGRYPIRSHVLDVGQRHPLGVAAHGIAILAALDDDEVASVISENEARYARDYPCLTADFLWRLVHDTRVRGWSLNRGFFHENAWAVGTVVQGIKGEIFGALSIGAMKDRLDETRQVEIAALLKKEAARMRDEHIRFERLESRCQQQDESSKTRSDRKFRKISR